MEGAGGRIDLDPTKAADEATGAAFTIELPTCKAVVSSHSITGTPPATGRGELVLVAEDDLAFLVVATRVLRAAGFEVHTAVDGDEAIRRIDALVPRLRVVVSDVMMPGRDGYDVADYVARVAPEIPIILMSGYSDPNRAANSSAQPPILWKPFSAQDLRLAVATALDRSPSRSRMPAVDAGLDWAQPPGVPAQTSLRATTPASRASRPTHNREPTPTVIVDVLVVEDHNSLRNGLARVLRAAGYGVKTAATVAAARQVVQDGYTPGVLICDAVLPDGTVPEFIGWLETAAPELLGRVVIITGGPVGSLLTVVGAHPAIRILRKPIHPARLLAEIENL